MIFAPYDPFDDTNELRVVRKLAGIVRAMDKGVLSPNAVQKSFTEHPIPGFCFERWLREMVEEGIYSDTALKGVAKTSEGKSPAPLKPSSSDGR